MPLQADRLSALQGPAPMGRVVGDFMAGGQIARAASDMPTRRS